MKKTATEKTFSKFFNFGIFPKWTIKNMVFVAILIALSVSFTVVAAQILPIVNIPSYKFSFIGLPVKITGFIFGPVIGVFVGIVSDLLSLIFVPPAGYNPVYTVATAMNGLVAGLFGMYFLSFLNYAFSKKYRLEKLSIKITLLSYKYKQLSTANKRAAATSVANKIIALNSKRKFINENDSKHELKLIYLFSGSAFMLLCIAITVALIGFVISDTVIEKSFIPNRFIILGLTVSGMAALCIFIIVGYFFIDTEKYLVLVPIIVFSAFLSLINIPILSYADLYSLGNGTLQDIFIWITQHILTTPIKIWFNVFVIYYAYTVISKLIYKNNKLSY
ncbi:ECF transporter S component [Mycoplasma nasistruthionis]|uniref:ECF transporter S component n=1 Tax=Mycoplasma nasistruthionis TaxID=353852 RepID=A0A5B7XW20_9MOLU|nr:ECF transporter S component [Mycoplasma nasistruthionis]QCZ36704.1 hypothetical protein FG904_01600 [Mycoplasma nasistruthionis]